MRKWTNWGRIALTGALCASLAFGGSASVLAASAGGEGEAGISAELEALYEEESAEYDEESFQEDLILSDEELLEEEFFEEQTEEFFEGEFSAEDTEEVEESSEELADEPEGSSNQCGPNATYTLEDGKLVISGTGEISDYGSAEAAPWHEYAESITKVEIGAGITTIGTYDFAGLKKLTDVTLPSTLTTIKDSAFDSCESLKAIVIPESVNSIGDKTFAGTSGLTIKGKYGSYAETFATSHGYQFAAASTTDLSAASVTVGGTFVYNGNAFTPAVTVTLAGATLVKDRDYTVSSYANNINAGTATVTVTGIKNYSGTKSGSFVIQKASIAGATVSGIVAKTYTGVGITQTPTVILGGKTLAAGKDYTLSYANNVKVGTASVTINGAGNYTGALSRNFKINKALMKTAKVSNVVKKVYTGKAITQKPVVVIAGQTLKKGRDYTLSYKNNIKIGKATMFIKGKGNYKGKIKRTFKIQKASLADATIKEIPDYSYTGSAIQPSVTVKYGKRTLKSGTDYTVSYKNNVNVGTATVVLKGRGNYKGSNSASFNINKADIKNATIKNLTDKAYTGNPVTQNPEITLSGRTLKQNTDYTLTYKNNVEVGTATVVIQGKGNYTGTRVFQFKIKKLSISDASISGITDKTYTGNPVQQNITVTLGGSQLRKGREYTVSYSNNTEVGTATMTISGAGGITGSVTKSFYILPPGTSLQGVQRDANKKLVVSWTAKPNIVDGYQIQYSTDSSFSTSRAIQMVGSTNSKYTFTPQLGSATSRIYVRVRTYKRSGNMLVYSTWSGSASA